MVQAWIKANVRGPQYWHPKPPLKEITTDEVRTRLKSQVFRLDDDSGSVSEACAYLIRGAEVIPFSTGLGGNGLLSMCVCDLDENGAPELAYSYSWGSGIHRSQVEVLCFDHEGVAKVPGSFAVRDVDVILKKVDDATVQAQVADAGAGNGLRIGTLSLASRKTKRHLDLRLHSSLHPGLRAKIWRQADERK